ncbi:MAG TPA: hypothetical protein VM869_11390, partial [Enhygromyxa sp.]|nr:hypothetical protein [Enhygromyxa sp.]
MRAREIPDSGLRLAVLNALIPLGHLDEEDLRAMLADICDPEVESPWEHEDEWISKALERLAEVEIDPTHLSAIDQLDFVLPGALDLGIADVREHGSKILRVEMTEGNVRVQDREAQTRVGNFASTHARNGTSQRASA